MNHYQYVPTLKWKMGEYQALARLSETVKKSVAPLLELTPPGFDFESNEDRKTYADHLRDFGKRLSSKWQARRCFVDFSQLREERVGRQHIVAFIFSQIAEYDCGAIPVVSIANDRNFLDALRGIHRLSDRGLCIRLTAEDFDDPKLAEKLTSINEQLEVGWGKTDIVFDLCTPAYRPRTAYRAAVEAMTTAVPSLNKARSVVVSGTNYPKTLAEYKDQQTMIPRHEWTGYKDFVASRPATNRIPTFGDYGGSHPDLVELDMRMVKPFAKLKYTIEDAWYLARGKAVRTEGFEQFREMCRMLIEKEFFEGPGFSAGDEYIYDCARGNAKTGNLSTWVWVATNHHVTKTVSDLASFHEL